MKSPLCDVLLSLGGRYEDAANTGVPRQFGDPQQEYAAARQAAAVIDRSPGTKIELRGRDRVRFLHNLCTNDIKGLAIGHGCEAFLTNVQGRTLAYVRVFAGAESHWIDTVPDAAAGLLAHMNHYLVTEQVELVDRTNDYAQMFLVGPQASPIVTAVAGSSVAELADLSHLEGTIAGVPCQVIHNDSLLVGLRGLDPPYKGVRCQVIRNDSLGLPGYEFRVPADQAVAVWQAIWQAGQSLGLRAMGGDAYEMLRIEAGLPVYGADIDATNFSQEVRRDERTISYTKGCYLGQETVHRIWTMGHVNRYLVGLAVPGSPAPLSRGSVVSAGGQQIGKVTSSTFSPALGCTIALGYVRRGFEKPETDATIECDGGSVAARVHELPFPVT